MSENQEDHVELYNVSVNLILSHQLKLFTEIKINLQSLITVSKKIYWKIAHFDKIVEIPGQKIQSKWVPINDPRDNRKICDLNLQIYKDCEDEDEDDIDDIYFKIDSTPVAESIVLEANVAVFDAKMKEKLHEAKFILKEYEKGQKFYPTALNLMDVSSLTEYKEKYLAENGVLNVRCVVISSLSSLQF